jgi:hypothetical protein
MRHLGDKADQSKSSNDSYDYGDSAHSDREFSRFQSSRLAIRCKFYYQSPLWPSKLPERFNFLILGDYLSQLPLAEALAFTSS